VSTRTLPAGTSSAGPDEVVVLQAVGAKFQSFCFCDPVVNTQFQEFFSGIDEVWTIAHVAPPTCVRSGDKRNWLVALTDLPTP